MCEEIVSIISNLKFYELELPGLLKTIPEESEKIIEYLKMIRNYICQNNSKIPEEYIALVLKFSENDSYKYEIGWVLVNLTGKDNCDDFINLNIMNVLLGLIKDKSDEVVELGY